MAGLLVVAVLSLGRGAPAATAAVAPSRLVTITIPGRVGAIPQAWLGYPGPPRANVLLPAGYDPHRRYPLLVALHGLNCNYAWYAQAGLTKVFAGLDAIVVMPEGGSGWYADWWNDGRPGDPAWETYELEDVLPTILARFPILPDRRDHAIVGISMGGLGAPYLGGRLPGFFGSVASLSGFVDPEWFAPITAPAMGLTAFAPLNGELSLSPVLGPPNGYYMRGHNPTDLVTNLRQTRVFVTSGTGAPSAAAPHDPTGSLSEGGIIYPMNQFFHAALVDAGVDVTYRAQPGGHNNADFADELRAMLAWGPFKPVETAPRSWVNHTVATSGRLWDLSYAFDRSPQHVVEVRRDGSLLSISAAGADVTVTTDRGCVLRAPTPASFRIPAGRCR